MNRVSNILIEKLTKELYLTSIRVEAWDENSLHLKGFGHGLYPFAEIEKVSSIVSEFDLVCTHCSTIDDTDCLDRIRLTLKSK